MTKSFFLPLLAESGLPAPLPVPGLADGSSALWIAVLLALVLVNAFFVVAEVSLLRVHASQLEEAAEEKKRGAALALHVNRHAEAYLAACQFGITLSSIVLGALGEPFLSALLFPLLAPLGLGELLVRWIAFALAVLVLTILNTIIGEQIPRTFGFRKTVGSALASSGPLRVFYPLVAGPVWLINLVSGGVLKLIFRLEPVDPQQTVSTADELKLMVEETGRAQEVTETEREILENALELNELVVRDILTPRNEVVVLDVHRTFKENLEIALESKHTRFPLVDGHLDRTLGLIHIKDLLREMNRDSSNLFAAKRDLIRVSEQLPLDELLKLFLAERAHIALVVDEFGGSAGLVMLDDVLDQVVGDIHDEFDDEEENGFQRIDDESFVVQGWLPLHELADEVGDLELEDPDVSTIGGYLTSHLGRIPEPGESTSIEGYVAEIVEADERTVKEIRFEKAEETVEEETEERDTESPGEEGAPEPQHIA